MNRANDLDAYFKKSFEGETQQPSTYAWGLLTDRLEKSELKKKRHTFCVKMALFLLALFSGFQFTSDRDIQPATSVGIMGVDVEGSIERTLGMTATQLEESQSKASKITNLAKRKPKPRVAEEWNGQKPDSSPVLKPNSGITMLKKVESEADKESVIILDAPKLAGPVTVEEIEALMGQARHNRQLQRKRLLEQKMMAYQLLAEMEHEMQARSHKGFYDNVKHGFKKFKMLIAN